MRIRAVFWLLAVGFVTGGTIGYYAPKAVGYCIAGVVMGGLVMEVGVAVAKIERGGFSKWIMGESDDDD